MPSTYSDQLRLELQATGENANTWGSKTNTNLELIESAISGMVTVATTGGTTTLTTTSGADDQARHAIIKITGVLVSNATIEVPDKTKHYLVWNATTGSYTAQIKTSGGTGTYVPQDGAMWVFCDATNVYSAERSVVDSTFKIADETDPTKQLAFQLSGITTGTTRTLTVPDASGTLALTSNKLSAFAATTSAELAGVISDETGSGSLVFANTPTLVTPNIGAATGTSLAVSTVDTTNLEVTNIKAKDGTASASIADATGVMTVGSSVLTTTDINGGTIDGTTQASGTINGPIAVGGTWTAAATWTLPAFTLGGTVTSNGQSFSGTIANLGTVTTADINGGTIDGATIGGSSAAAGTFTTLTSTGNATLGDAEATDTHAVKGATTLLANSASAALTVTQTGAGNAFVVEDSTSPDSTPFVVTADGLVGVGVSSPQAGLHVSGIITQQRDTSTNQSLMSAGGTFNRIWQRRASGTNASPTIVASGDAIGDVLWSGYDGSEYMQAASIQCSVDGTPGTNDMPGRLIFSTTADGASSPTERMRIDSAGRTYIGGTTGNEKLNVAGAILSNSSSTNFGQDGVQIDYATDTGRISAYKSTGSSISFWTNPSGGANAKQVDINPAGLLTLTAGQIKFPATQNASADANTLDDYEEGTWTPSVGGTATYSVQNGKYTKIGNKVWISGAIALTSIGTGSASAISGLPFTSAVGVTTGGSISYYTGLAVNVITPVIYLADGTTTLNVKSATSAGTDIGANLNALGSGARIDFSLFYTV